MKHRALAIPYQKKFEKAAPLLVGHELSAQLRDRVVKHHHHERFDGGGYPDAFAATASHSVLA